MVKSIPLPSAGVIKSLTYKSMKASPFQYPGTTIFDDLSFC